MTATHDPISTLPTAPVVSFSLELGWNTWSSCLAKHIGEDSISLARWSDRPKRRTVALRARSDRPKPPRPNQLRCCTGPKRKG